MATIQFKRILNYDGTFDEAVAYVNSHLSTLKLSDGEPIIVSYNNDGELSYFLIIYVKGKLKVFPSFANQSDFVSFVKKVTGSDLVNSITDDSDITIEYDESSAKYRYKLKDNLSINNI